MSMTKDEEMALRELAAGRCVIPKVTKQLGPMSLWSKDAFERELAKARAEEREACAQICADRAKDFQELFLRCEYEEDEGAMKASLQCEELIRARGQQ